jgi:hypothetical protein
MPKTTTTAAEKASALLEAAQTRFDKKTAQHAVSSALTDRLAREVNEAEAARDYAAKHPALQNVDADAEVATSDDDASTEQGDVKDDGETADPFADL